MKKISHWLLNCCVSVRLLFIFLIRNLSMFHPNRINKQIYLKYDK